MASKSSDSDNDSPALRIDLPVDDITITTDPKLLSRTITNMVKNAMEATPADGEVRVWCESSDDYLTIHVQNPGVIPKHLARQVFKRYFTTKSDAGHGVGTHSMKLLGEYYLGGASKLHVCR